MGRMNDHDHELPAAVDTKALLALSDEHHDRPVRPLGTHEAAGHVVKAYALEAPGRTVTEQDADAALRIAEAHLALGRTRGSLGLAVLIVHAGGDGDYVLVHTWIEGLMADLAIFTGPVGRLDELRPGRTGLAPCVWEAAVLSHERDAYSRHVLDGGATIADRLRAWQDDTLEGTLR